MKADETIDSTNKGEKQTKVKFNRLIMRRPSNKLLGRLILVWLSLQHYYF